MSTSARNLTGLVISQGRMNKSVKVRVLRTKYNRKVHKDIVMYRDFIVHDELNLTREGDVVRLQPVPKLSSRKSFAVMGIMKAKGTEWQKYQLDAPQQVQTEEIEHINEYKQDRDQRQAAQSMVDKLREAFTEASAAQLEGSLSTEKKQELLAKYGLTDSTRQFTDNKAHLTAIGQELQHMGSGLSLKEFSDAANSWLTLAPQQIDTVLESLHHDPSTMSPEFKVELLVQHFHQPQL